MDGENTIPLDAEDISNDPEDAEKLLESFRSQISNIILVESVSDNDIKRFLRARSWNVEKSSEMFRKWAVWRSTPLSDGSGRTPSNILNDPADPNEHVYQELLPHSNHGFDKKGRPVYWEKTGDISGRFPVIIQRITGEDIVVRHVRQQEMMMRRIAYASNKFGRNIQTQTVVTDLSNLSYSLHATALSLFRQTVEIDDAFYPERLGCFIFINTPWIFRPLWAMIKMWLSPVTVGKFHFLGSDYQSALTSLVDNAFIPVEYGGSYKATWQWPYPEGSGCSPSELLNIVLPMPNNDTSDDQDTKEVD
eukprot:c12241_g1_i1.p1 GENE.c12241_g1_i1~~c12241_g1_i1.p1  ORF type:complete len:322 (-),score=49.60 c12241_g1_i1:292-1209(-)